MSIVVKTQINGTLFKKVYIIVTNKNSSLQCSLTVLLFMKCNGIASPLCCVTGGCGGRPSILLNDVWLLTMLGDVWEWVVMRVHNPEWSMSHPSNGQLWCHPSCKVQLIIPLVLTLLILQTSFMHYLAEIVDHFK